MLKERHFYISIGTLVVLGFISLLFLAIKVSGEEPIFGRKPTYLIQAEFSNVGQLKPNARVAIGGVKIGRVRQISLKPSDFTATVSIEIESTYNQIPADSEIQIVTAGLLGDQYLTITPGFEHEFLENGAYLDLSQTHSALILEDLLGKFLTSMSQKRGS